MITHGMKAEEVETLVEVVLALTRKHGFLLKTPWFQETLRRIDAPLADFVVFLEGLGKLNIRALKALQTAVHEHPSFVKNHVTVTTSHPQSVKEDLQAKTSHKTLEVEETKEIGMLVEWQGKIYKRNLSRDLSTLLS